MKKKNRRITSKVSGYGPIIAMSMSRVRQDWATGAYLAKQFVIQNAREKFLQPALARFDKL
jgi:hypothetical protein